MASETFTLLITTQGATRAAKQIQGIGAAANSVRRVLGFLRSALVVIASARIVGGLTKLADGLTIIRNRLRLVTASEAELNVVAAQLLDISDRTRTSFAENVEFFNRTARATQTLGLTFKELLVISESVALAIKVSGATAEEAVGGLRQLSQALAAGAAQGEELRSIVENLPRLADAIGRSFGLSGGQLIAFNKQFEGIIKSEAIAKGLIDEIQILRKEFENVRFTVEDAVQVFNNRLLVFVGNLNDATGAGRKLSDIILLLAGNLDKVLLAIGLLLGATVLNFVAKQFLGIVATVKTLVKAVLLLGLAMIRVVAAPIIGGFRLLRFVVFGTVAAVKALTLAIFANPMFSVPIIAVIAGLAAAFFLMGGTIGDIPDVMGELRTAFDNLVTVSLAAVQTIIGALDLVGPAFIEASKKAGIGLSNFFVSQLEKVSEFLFGGGFGDDFDIAQPDTPNLDELVKNYEANVARIVGAGGGTAVIKKSVKDFAADIKGLTKLVAGDLDLLNKTPTIAGGTGGVLDDPAVTKSIEKINKLVAAISPLLAVSIKLEAVNKELNTVTDAGIDLFEKFGVTRKQFTDQAIRDLVGAGKSARQFAEEQQVLKNALDSTSISFQEYIDLIREARIEQAEAEGGVSGGVNAFFLKLQRDAADTAGQIEAALTSAFKGAEDALIEFVQNGTFNFSKLIDSLLADLTRLAFRGAVADLSSLLGLGVAASGEGSGAAQGGLLNDIFGSAGKSGFFGKLFGSLPGAAHGGGFDVGGSGGLDQNVLSLNGQPQLRVSRGERVTVTPKGGGVSQPLSITMNFNGPTDVNSIERSRTQIEAGLSRSLNRAAARNG